MCKHCLHIFLYKNILKNLSYRHNKYSDIQKMTLNG